MREITTKDLPLLVLVDTIKPNFFGWGIKAHQNGMYTHAMWAYRIEEGEVICLSQELLLKDRKLSKWLDGKHYVKIWTNPKWDAGSKTRMISRCGVEKSRSWFRRRYDFLGIIGQQIGYYMPFKFLRKIVRKINVPWLDYCSENAGEKLKYVEAGFRIRHPSPKDLNDWCNQNRENGMEVFDRFIPEEM